VLGAGEGESLGAVVGVGLGGISLGVGVGAGELGVVEGLGSGALGAAGTAGVTAVAGAGVELAVRRVGEVGDSDCCGAARRSIDTDGDVDVAGVWVGGAGATEALAGFGFGCGLVRTVVLATVTPDPSLPRARTTPVPVPMAATASATASAYGTARRWATGSIRRWTPRYRACTGRLHQMGPRGAGRAGHGRLLRRHPAVTCRGVQDHAGYGDRRHSQR
jgi:hypothetical protein